MTKLLPRFAVLFFQITVLEENLFLVVAYRQSRNTIREAYEERFSGLDTREVAVHRVVSIVDVRNPMPQQKMDYNRRFQDDQRCSGPRNFHDSRDFFDEGYYQSTNDSYFDENPNYVSFFRNSSPPRNEGHFSHHFNSRDDRYQSESRKNSRPRNFRNRGRGLGPPRRQVVEKKAKGDQDCRISSVITRECSPARSKSLQLTHGGSGSNTSNQSFSPDKDKSHTPQQAQQKQKPNVPVCLTLSDPVEDSPHSSEATKEKTPATVLDSEEVVASSMELKLTPEKELNTRRLEAIKAKALEIEKHYRQDCETFRMVVKMLVAKEPSLDNLLQAPLDENLLEIKQRCLDSLRHFVKELDESIGQSDTSVKSTKHRSYNMDS